VLLRVLRETLYVDTLRLDPRGVAVVLLVGDVRLGGIAGDAVQDTLRARLSQFVNPNAVEAVLLRRVRVFGEVLRPGLYYVDRTATIRDAVAMAGGVTAAGYDRRLSLVRPAGATELQDWRLGAEGALALESGDELVVLRLPWYRRDPLALVSAIGILASIIVTVRR
jgi:protein involved in polysaccharide export with SLBB domain